MATNPNSQKILNTVTDIFTLLTVHDEKGSKYDQEFKEYVALRFADLENRITLFEAKLDGAKARTKAATGTGSKTTTGPSAETGKYYSNSMYYFIGEWKTKKDKLTQEYLSDEIIKSTANYMETNAEAKAKQGAAKVDFEAKYIWNTYIKNNDVLKNKIKEAYTKDKVAHDKSQMSQAVKENDSNA